MPDNGVEDKAGIMSMGVVDDDEPVATVVADDDPKPDEPEADDAGETKKDDKSVKDWDPERQARDEKRAARDRERDAQFQKLEGGFSELKDLVTTVLTARAESGESPTPAEDDEIATLLAGLDDLDDVSDPDQTKVLRQLARMVKDSKTGMSSKFQDLEKRFEDAAKERDAAIQELQDKTTASANLAASDRANKNLDDHLDRMDKQYGNGTKILRKEAIAAAVELLEEQGFNKTDNLPPPAAANLAVRAAYQEVAAKAAARKAKDAKKLSTQLDSLSGGNAAKSQKRGKLAETIESMRSEGKLSHQGT